MDSEYTGYKDSRQKIPIVIGVTGHRSLHPEGRRMLGQAVREEFRRIKRRYPHSPLVFLSSLAEGADQLCAGIALEEGFRLYVPLPLPVGEYAADFTGEVRETFLGLLRRADRVFVAPETEEYREGRDYCYRQAGIYVARHCHLLLALWDGKPGKAGGCGTADIMDYRLHQTDQRLMAARGGAVWIRTDRDTDDPAQEETPRIVRYGQEKTEKSMEETERFNRKAEGGAYRSPYEAADRLSVDNGRQDQRVLALLSVCSTVLTMAFLLYDEMSLHWMILVCGVMLLCLYGIYVWTRKSGYHRYYMEYRILAEGLRVQSFLHTAGTSLLVGDMLPWSWQCNTPWIRDAFYAVMAGIEPGERQPVREVWMADQKNYHEHAVRRLKRQAGRNERLVSFSLVITITAYIAGLLFEIFYGGLFSGRPLLAPDTAESIRTYLKILMGSLSAITLFAGNYYGKLSLDERIRDHSRMIALYKTALARTEIYGETEEILQALAAEELGENNSWYAYRSNNGPDISL